MATIEETGPLAERTGFVDALQHVLLFADWRARGSAPCVCKTWRDALLQDKSDSHWQWLCERLHRATAAGMLGSRKILYRKPQHLLVSNNELRQLSLETKSQ